MNAGTGNGMWRTWGMTECYIPGNVAKHTRECPQTFREMSSNIPGKVLKHSGECRQTLQYLSLK